MPDSESFYIALVQTMKALYPYYPEISDALLAISKGLTLEDIQARALVAIDVLERFEESIDIGEYEHLLLLPEAISVMAIGALLTDIGQGRVLH